VTQEDFAEELRRISEWQEFNNALMSVCEKSEPYRVDEVHNPHDKGYKYVLSIKKYFVEFVKNFMEISLDEEERRMLEEKFIKEEFRMENLARIRQSIHDDILAEGIARGRRVGFDEGFSKGMEREKVLTIKRLLSHKLNINLYSKKMELLDDVPIEKINKIEEKIFEITSWKDVREIIEE